MLDKSNREDIIKIIVFAIIIILLSIFAIVIHKNYDFDMEEKKDVEDIENIPINDLEPNKIKKIEGLNGIYYYEMEDYGDFQSD